MAICSFAPSFLPSLLLQFARCRRHHRRIASLPRPSVRPSASVRRATQSSVRPPGGRNAPLSPAKLRNEVDWMGRVSLLSRPTSKMALSPPLTNSTGTSAATIIIHLVKFLTNPVFLVGATYLSYQYHCLLCLQIMGTIARVVRQRRGRQAAVFNPEPSWSSASARAPCIYNFIPWPTASYILSADGSGGPKPFAAAAASP